MTKPVAKESVEAAASAEPVSISVDAERRVSGLLQRASDAGACYVVAHGAGAGMMHPFLGDIAKGLAERRVSALRYQFPYMEQGSKRPDAPKLAQATVRAAVVKAASLVPELALDAAATVWRGFDASMVLHRRSHRRLGRK